MAGDWLPGRHNVGGDDAADVFGPGGGVVEGHECERCDVVRAVAALALGLDDAGDIPRIGWLGVNRGEGSEGCESQYEDAHVDSE